MIVHAGPCHSDVVWCNPIHVQLNLSRGWGKAKEALAWLTGTGKPSKSWQCVALPHHAWRWDDRLRHGRQSEAALVLPKSHPCSEEHWGFRWLWPGRICNLGTPYPTPSPIHHRRLRVAEYSQGGIARHVVARPSLCHRICRGQNNTHRMSELFSSKRCYDVAHSWNVPWTRLDPGWDLHRKITPEQTPIWSCLAGSAHLPLGSARQRTICGHHTCPATSYGLLSGRLTWHGSRHGFISATISK